MHHPADESDKASRLRERLIRNFDDVPLRHEQRAPLYDTRCARLAAGTAARQLGIGIDTVAPGRQSCPYHFHHAQEEAFVILEGEGTLRVAGERLAVRAGDTIFIPAGPDYPHHLINTSAAPLKYLSISTQHSPEICEYPDSGKYQASAARDGDPNGFCRMHREKDDLDYWDGEP